MYFLSIYCKAFTKILITYVVKFFKWVFFGNPLLVLHKIWQQIPKTTLFIRGKFFKCVCLKTLLLFTKNCQLAFYNKVKILFRTVVNEFY